MNKKRIKVSLVDDDAGTRENLKTILNASATLACLHTYGSGEEAVREIPVNPPDVVLMDINLPGISGIEAMRILHADPVTAHIPIIAISANAVPRDIEKALAAGFFSYLTKPIKVSQFMDALDVALDFAQTPAGRAA